jgi:hypothetical protein
LNRPERLALAAAFLISLGAPLSALTIRAGLSYGPRSINNELLTTTYRPGSVFTPSFELGFGKGWFAGVAYETGPQMSGKLGLYDSAAVFTLSGLEIYGGYELRLKSFALFARAGYGPYSYKQTVDYTYAEDHPVEGTRWAVTAAAGLKLYPWKFLYLTVGAKFAALKAKPYDGKVDLGGWRLLAGLGFAFGL